MPSQPLINGFEYQFASIDVRAGNRAFSRITKFSYSDECRTTDVRGIGGRLLGRVSGQYEARLSLEILKTEEADFLDVFRNEAGEIFGKGVEIVVSYADAGQKVVTEYIHGARLTSRRHSHSAGNEPLTVAFDLVAEKIGTRP